MSSFEKFWEETGDDFWLHKTKKDCAKNAWHIALDELWTDIIKNDLDKEDILLWLKQASRED